MPDVFLSYAREDRAWVEQLGVVLKERNLNVWWDAELSVGGEYSKELQDQLELAKSVVVLWSHHSVASTFVRDEAAYARDHDKLVPVSIDSAPIPLGFRQFHVSKLIGWIGDSSSDSVDAVVQRISELTSVEVQAPVSGAGSGWLDISKEAARRHRLFGFSGALLAIYLGVITNFVVGLTLQLGYRDGLIMQHRNGFIDPEVAAMSGWAPIEGYLEITFYGIITQSVMFIPFLLLPMFRRAFVPYVAAVGLFFGQILWPGLWLPIVQPVSSYILPQISGVLFTSGVAAYLILSDRVKLTYAHKIRNELFS